MKPVAPELRNLGSAKACVHRGKPGGEGMFARRSHKIFPLEVWLNPWAYGQESVIEEVPGWGTSGEVHYGGLLIRAQGISSWRHC